jgi:hypothetical protein
MNAGMSITGLIVFAITCPSGFEANSPTAFMMPHVLIDNEIGRPKVVEPSGVEGYFARLRGLVARVARVDYLG